jgi:hypothetical protein
MKWVGVAMVYSGIIAGFLWFGYVLFELGKRNFGTYTAWTLAVATAIVCVFLVVWSFKAVFIDE